MRLMQDRLGRARRLWSAQDSASKWLITASLLLIIFAYLPSLQFDYVAPDQFRAFQYSTDARTPEFRFIACRRKVTAFFILTGRPLLGIGECLEDATVARMADFALARPLLLLIVLVTALYLGAVIAPMAGGWGIGVMAASAFVMTPGYAFMYLQGMTAVMLLICALLAAASFNMLRRALDNQLAARRNRLIAYGCPYVAFLAACFTYPAWAFLVVPLVLLEFGFSDERTAVQRIRRLLHYLLFYLAAAVTYYLLVRAMTYAALIALRALRHVNQLPDLAEHTVSMQLSPGVLLVRAIPLVKYFYGMEPLSFITPRGLPVAVLAFFSLYVGFRWRRPGSWRLASGALLSLLVFVVSSVVLLGAMSPLLFSMMNDIDTRWLIPWYLFFCVVSLVLLSALASALPFSSRLTASMAVLLVGLVPIAVMQNKVSILEVTAANYEMGYLKQRLAAWIDAKGYHDQRYLLFVLPRTAAVAPRTATFVDTDMRGAANLQENAMLASEVNPMIIPTLVNAALREWPQVAASVNVIYCELDQSCVADNLAGRNSNIVVGLTYGPVKTAQQPFIINLSTLTTEPQTPTIEVDRSASGG